MASASATVRASWKDQTHAHIAATVAEGGIWGNVTYIGHTRHTNDDGTVKPDSQILAECIADASAQRAKQITPKGSIAGVPATINI
jgi:hypothetical protein